ncbi:MAG: DUF2332 domain-containing protein, partial [Chloroflexi bacterium]|nr:DUF2332 domain-containing protein [Chloroflexota bacterium]
MSAFYRSVAGSAVQDGDPAPAFRAFCLEHRSAIIELIAVKLVQTNEVRRCSYLLPSFAFIQQQAGGRPLALIEVGASAGLNLLFDRYAYQYGQGPVWGVQDSPVTVACAVQNTAPPLPETMPAVAWRRGIDLNPINATDPDAAHWLRALVWPEHPERAAMLERALAVARR